MTEAFVAIVAIMIASLVAPGAAVVIVGALAAWRDWQRERASLNCGPGSGRRLQGVGRPANAALRTRPQA